MFHYSDCKVQHCSRGLNCSAQESVVTYVGNMTLDHKIRDLLACREEKWMSETVLFLNSDTTEMVVAAPRSTETPL